MRKNALWTLGGGLLTLGSWWGLAITLGPTLLPAPQDVVARFGEMVFQEGLVNQAWITLSRSFIAALGALGLGFLLGNLTGRDKRLERLGFIPYVVLQGMPPLVWTVPLVVLFYGQRELLPGVVVFLVVLPLGFINIQNSRQNLPLESFHIFKIYAGGRFSLRLRELYLPHLTPAIQSSLSLGLVLGLKSAIIGEWVGGREGLGRLMYSYYNLFDLKSFLAVTAIFLTMVLGMGALVHWLGGVLFPLKKSLKEPTPKGLPLVPLPPRPEGLSIKNGRFSYPTHGVFTDLNIVIPPGQTMVLTGHSGSGKTTLARLALGLLSPRAGDWQKPSRPGYLSQDDGLLNHRDALGNVALPLWARKEPHWKLLGVHYLNLVGLGDKISRFPSELSGGEKKRLSFARALAYNPGFMVLDEPFNNLDKNGRDELWDLYWKLFPLKGLTSLIITHYPEELLGKSLVFCRLDSGLLTIQS